jgi:DNA mismatch repair ATPase MutS
MVFRKSTISEVLKFVIYFIFVIFKFSTNKTYICTYRWFEDDYHKFRKAVLHIATLDSLLSLASVARLHGYCRFVSTLDSLLSLASVARLHGYCRFVSTLDSLLSLASVARYKPAVTMKSGYRCYRE